ncbi:hypothetical protein GJ744_001450 [Endocarpon pusillum]|uniref:Uncharacterized protein n=1 Tax=Endocarpon pusillum TaxID=364733 RepID=A0A8H7E8N0_9EURO|nr:hypothetical protein GJ744_001450 [Endocarpon pusillum]
MIICPSLQDSIGQDQKIIGRAGGGGCAPCTGGMAEMSGESDGAVKAARGWLWPLTIRTHVLAIHNSAGIERGVRIPSVLDLPEPVIVGPVKCLLPVLKRCLKHCKAGKHIRV